MPKIDMLELEKDTKKTWESSKEIRAEFSSYENYLAYSKAKAKGLLTRVKNA